MSPRPPQPRPGALFWTLWGVALGAGALGLGWFSYTGIAAVRAAQVHFRAGESAVRAELEAGTSTVFYEYEGPPPSHRYQRALPKLACVVRVVQTGVEVPIRPSPRLDSYKLGMVTGVSLMDVEVRSSAAHDVACSLAEPFPEEGPVRLVLGRNVMSEVGAALAGPLLSFLALVGVLVAVLWRRLKA